MEGQMRGLDGRPDGFVLRMESHRERETQKIFGAISSRTMILLATISRAITLCGDDSTRDCRGLCKRAATVARRIVPVYSDRAGNGRAGNGRA